VNWFTATPLPDDLLPGRAERRSTTPRDSPCTMETRHGDHGMPGHRMATATPSLDQAGNIAVRGNYVGRHRELAAPLTPSPSCMNPVSSRPGSTAPPNEASRSRSKPPLLPALPATAPAMPRRPEENSGD
jgi:hypothetical protein